VHRHGSPILIRSDSAGCTHGLLAHIRGLREHGVGARFSVGVAITEPIRQAILPVKQHGTWVPAVDADSDPRDGAQVAELTGLVPDDGYPAGTRFIVRRERPHPGAQLSFRMSGCTTSVTPSCRCSWSWACRRTLSRPSPGTPT
jgi:hypothetical protein